MPIHIDTKYINLLSPRLERFQWKKQSLAVCRCPMCGDSQKSKNKTRFYFFEKKGAFLCKCHNCDYSATLGWLLKTLDLNLYKQYSFDVLKETGVSHGRTRTGAHAPTPVRKAEDKVLSLLPRLDSLKSDHPAVKWVEKRQLPKEALSILYFSENYGEWAKNIDPEVQAGDDERIVIPILDADGKILGAQGRIIDQKKIDRKTIRYITVKADKNSGKSWFGIERCDPKKPVIVVEGPLDSLFLDNAVAMVGLSDATNIPKEFRDSELIYVLDNEPRNKQVVEAMERLIDDGHSVCIWSDRFRGMKDINEMIIAGFSKVSIMHEIHRNSHSGLGAHVALKRWAK